MIRILPSLLAKLYKYILLYKNTGLLILLKSELFEDKAWVNMVYDLLYSSSTQQTAAGPSEMPPGEEQKTDYPVPFILLSLFCFQFCFAFGFFFFFFFFLAYTYLIYFLFFIFWALFAPSFVLLSLFLI